MLCVISLPLRAQQVFGTLDGNVTDSSGALLANATVTIHDTAKNIDFKTATNSSGFYSQGQLIPGVYTVAIEASGFAKDAVHPL